MSPGRSTSLEHGRALGSVLSKDAATEARFLETYADQFRPVREYYATVRHLVDTVDLVDLVLGVGGDALEALRRRGSRSRRAPATAGQRRATGDNAP